MSMLPVLRSIDPPISIKAAPNNDIIISQYPMTDEQEERDFGFLEINDPTTHKLVVESILSLNDENNEIKRTKKQQASASKIAIDTLKSNRNMNKLSSVVPENNEDEEDFGRLLNDGKRFREYKMYEPPKFKILGYTRDNKPIFKISDVFLTTDPYVRAIIDRQFNEIIHGKSRAREPQQQLETGQLAKRHDKGYDFEAIVLNWEKKEYQEDFESSKRHKLDEKELEEIVVNRGDEKSNYFMYKTGERNNMTWGEIYNSRNITERIRQSREEMGRVDSRVNHILSNPKFKENMYKIVNRMRLQYCNIEQFEDEESNVNEAEVKQDSNEGKTRQTDEKPPGKSKSEADAFKERSSIGEVNVQSNLGNEEQDEENLEAEEDNESNEIEDNEEEEQEQESFNLRDTELRKQLRNKQLNEEEERLKDEENRIIDRARYSISANQEAEEEERSKKREENRLSEYYSLIQSLNRNTGGAAKNSGQPDPAGFVRYWGQSIQQSFQTSPSAKSTLRNQMGILESETIRSAQPAAGPNSKNSPQGFQKIWKHRKMIPDSESLVDQIIKEYSLINKNIIRDGYRGRQSVDSYNRIQFHMQNPNFFLTKLHSALQKKSEQFENFIEQDGNLSQAVGAKRGVPNPSTVNARDRSILSGSLGTGGQGTIRQPNQDGTGAFDEDHETIQQKILTEMNHNSRRPINHSDVATKLMFIKFTTSMEEFANYHRYEFKYEHHFNHKVQVKLMRHPKPRKNKGKDLNINLEKIDSYKKFSRPEHLSLGHPELKEFIVIEYIEENPLLMSDVGMCERMVIQVNNQEMLHKIKNDLINMDDDDFERYQDMRDNPENASINVSTDKKLDVWRRNIKEEFGENGRVFLWEPRREGKLIGNPEGLGVALMESNLAAVPIIKKEPNPRDFLLVRQGQKWIIRKIDSIYTSGQVEPKQVVFTPDNRHYQSFLENYQRDFIKKIALRNHKHEVMIEEVKKIFPNAPLTSAESRLRKILKNKMKAVSKDNKRYVVPIENGDGAFSIKPEDHCLYQRMQKSLCELSEIGIVSMKNMEKMKSILRKFFRKNKDSLEDFAIARMIRDQLQLTSWYLTESFDKFKAKKARIEMTGHADPTKGHGGYSFIKKPQKERTDKDEAEAKQEKPKLSGTQFDLRKLKQENSMEILLQNGNYRPEQIEGLKRWQLVDKVKQETDSPYARKERETKEEKQENEKRQRSKVFNLLLKNIKLQEDGKIQPYEYGYSHELTLNYYLERERKNWENSRENLQRKIQQKGIINEDDEDEDS